MDTTPATSSVEDLHASKIAPGDPRLRIPLPRGRTLKKAPALAVAILLAGVVALALAFAVQPAKHRAPQEQTAPTYRLPLPDTITAAADNSSPLASAAPPAHRAAGEGVGLPEATPRTFASQPQTQAQRDAEQAQKDAERARNGSIFADVGDVHGQDRDPPRASHGASSTGPGGPPPGGLAAGSSSTLPQDPNYQERKNEFVHADGAKAVDPYLEQPELKPKSPYEVMAGTIIPTVLITGINSDLPGEIIAQVRENVYDTVSGTYLLVPQGSRLLAKYDSLVAWGQERVLVCWNRLIRPDGSSISLGCMPGVDLAGYAGVADDVDNHWWRIITGAALSSLLSVGAQTTTGSIQGYNPNLAQQWTAGAAADVANAGQQITRRNLNIQPTITIRPGFSTNVIVSKDIVLSPYVE